MDGLCLHGDVRLGRVALDVGEVHDEHMAAVDHALCVEILSMAEEALS